MKTLLLLLISGSLNWESIRHVQEEKHLVYPNPAVEEVNVELDVFATGIYNIQLMDLVGNSIQQMEINSTSQLEPVSFNLKDLPKGYYFIRIEGATGTETIRLVKE